MVKCSSPKKFWMKNMKNEEMRVKSNFWPKNFCPLKKKCVLKAENIINYLVKLKP